MKIDELNKRGKSPEEQKKKCEGKKKMGLDRRRAIGVMSIVGLILKRG